MNSSNIEYMFNSTYEFLKQLCIKAYHNTVVNKIILTFKDLVIFLVIDNYIFFVEINNLIKNLLSLHCQ